MPSLPSIDEEFRTAETTIAWAKSGARELSEDIKAFLTANPPIVVVEDDPVTGEHVERLKFQAKLPTDFNRKATEALNNGRHSFDQIVFAARNVLGGRSNNGVNFPWSNSPTDVERLMLKRGIDLRLLQTILDHEPYPTSASHTGGDDQTRTMATIANSKHTVGLAFGANIQGMRPSIMFFGEPPRLALSPIVVDPTTNEAELARWSGGKRMESRYQFLHFVCLEDRRLAHRVDVTTALYEFAKKAEAVCRDVKRKCIELCA